MSGYDEQTGPAGMPQEMAPQGIVPPGEADGPDAWDRFHAALGRPDTPEGYALNRPEGGWYDDRLASWFREAAYRNGLSAKAAAGLHDAFVAEMARLMAGRGAESQAEAARLEQALRQEWGPRYEAKTALARRAAARLADGPALTALEEAIGAPALIQLFARLGEALGEDRLMGRGSEGRPMTADSARSRRGQLTRDAGFLAAFLDRSHPGHRDALREMEALNRAIAPDVRR